MRNREIEEKDPAKCPQREVIARHSTNYRFDDGRLVDYVHLNCGHMICVPNTDQNSVVGCGECQYEKESLALGRLCQVKI